MGLDIPVIETERLILRGRRKEDFPLYAAMWADPVVARHTGGRPLTEEEAWTKFARMEGFWALNGYGFFVVQEKGGAFVGEAGAAEFRREIAYPFEGKPEFGWGFLPAVHGRGYATEAVGAALEWAETALSADLFTCIIGPENAPSIRVAEKFGFRQTAETTYHGAPTLVFERSRLPRDP